MSFRITIGELPPRVRRPEGSALSQIFGGCNAAGSPCNAGIDCCSGACVSGTTNDPLKPPTTYWYCKHETMGGF